MRYINNYSFICPGELGLSELHQELCAGFGGVADEVYPLARSNADLKAGLPHSYQELDRVCLLGLQAARPLLSSGQPVRLITGSSRGVCEKLETIIAATQKGAKGRPRWSPSTTQSALAATLAQHFQLGDIPIHVSAACATFALALEMAMVLPGEQDVVLLCADAPITEAVVTMLAAAKVLTKVQCSQPFGRMPTGMALSEGAVGVSLSKNPALNPLGAVIGVGQCMEPATMTGVHPEGLGLKKAIHLALNQAGVLPSEIDLVVTHGSGTLKGDQAEWRAVEAVFHGVTPKPSVTAHKWFLGHSLSPSVGISLLLALMHLKRGEIPSLPYPSFIPMERQSLRPGASLALILCMGFGGFHAAIIVRRL